MCINANAARIETGEGHRIPLLAVGDAADWRGSAGALPSNGDDVLFVDLEDVTPELLHEVQPRVVVSAMLGRRFDCIDVGQRLIESGFRGCLRLVTDKLPRPDIVLHELREQCPGLHVQLGGPLRPVLVN